MMKKFLILLFFILFSCAEVLAQNLYPINDQNGGGYINKNGEIVIAQNFGFAQRFSGNYAIIEGKNSKYGVIDKKGNLVIPFEYEDLSNLSEDFVIYKENGKYGFIDIKNHKKSEPVFDKTSKFKEAACAVQKNGVWGFINKKGEMVIEPKYRSVSDFSEGLAAVSFSEHTTAGYINKKGQMVIEFDDNKLEPRGFSEGLAPVIKGDEKSCSYINKRGKVVIDNRKLYPMNVYCGSFYEGLTVFYIDQNPNKIVTGYIDKRGKAQFSAYFSLPKDVSEGEFSTFDDFSSHMAQFSFDYKTGYLNRKFQMVTPLIYEFARNFEHDLAYVKFEDKEGYINKKGQWVWTKEREGM